MKSTRTIGAIWGWLGVTLFLVEPIVRLAPRALEAVQSGLSSVEWLVLVAWSLFMLITEGYKGFQKQFSPRVASRIWRLYNEGEGVDLALAPFYAIGFFHTTKKRIITAYVLTTGIIALIVAVHFAPQPLRGMIDFGVVLGLSYGLVWFCIFTVQCFKTRTYVVEPE